MKVNIETVIRALGDVSDAKDYLDDLIKKYRDRTLDFEVDSDKVLFVIRKVIDKCNYVASNLEDQAIEIEREKEK